MPAEPAPTFVKLLVADPDRSVRFYEALGFVLLHRDPVFARLRWGATAELYLVTTPAGRALEGPLGVGVLVCFLADEPGVEEVAKRARRARSARVDGPQEMPWQTREVIVTDPDGYRLDFLQSIWPAS